MTIRNSKILVLILWCLLLNAGYQNIHNIASCENVLYPSGLSSRPFSSEVILFNTMKRTKFPKKETHYFYKITNLITGKAYVGSRKYLGEPTMDSYMGSSKYLKADIDIHGEQNFKKEILERVVFISGEKILKQESYHIENQNTLAPDGYNHFLPTTYPGFYTIGIKWSEKVRKNMSKGRKEFLKTPKGKDILKNFIENNPAKKESFKQKMSGENNPSKRPEVRLKLGYPKTKEHARKISEARKGKPWPNDLGLNDSKRQKAFYQTEAGKQKAKRHSENMKEYHKGRTDRSLSNEVKEKIRKSVKKYYKNKS